VLDDNQLKYIDPDAFQPLKSLDIFKPLGKFNFLMEFDCPTGDTYLFSPQQH